MSSADEISNSRSKHENSANQEFGGSSIDGNYDANLENKNAFEEEVEDSANQDRGASSSDFNFYPNLENIKVFEEEVVVYFETKLGKYKRIAEDPPVGKKGTQVNDAAAGFSSVAGITTAIVTAVVALPVAAAATMGAAGPVVLLGTVVVGKYVIKFLRRKECKAIVAATERFTLSILAYHVEQAGNELSRIFEYQLLMLKDASAAKIMARSAVDLMLNLKDGDLFDSNTLLQKVLDQKGSKGVVKKQKLETKCGIPSNKKKWHTPSVFWKPGLRKVVSSFDDGRREKIYKFDYWEKNDSKPQKYGFRGEFLLNENEKKSCSSSDHDVLSRHFIGSDVDKTYITKYQGNTREDYQPYHCLVLRTEDLKWFSEGIKTQPSFARFAAEMYNYPAARRVKPVYRPVNQPPVNEFLDLSNAILSESDFTAANFMGFTLRTCNLENCVSLFGNFQGAVLHEANFSQARLLQCKLDGVEAHQCTWTQATIHDCQVKDADFNDPILTVDMGSWTDTDLSKAKTAEQNNGSS